MLELTTTSACRGEEELMASCSALNRGVEYSANANLKFKVIEIIIKMATPPTREHHDM